MAPEIFWSELGDVAGDAMVALAKTSDTANLGYQALTIALAELVNNPTHDGLVAFMDLAGCVAASVCRVENGEMPQPSGTPLLERVMGMIGYDPNQPV